MRFADDFPALETERLRLRNLAADDLAFVFRHFADPDVHRYLSDEEPVTTLAQAQAIIDFYLLAGSPRLYNRWVLVRKADGQPIGTCGFHKWHRQHRRAEIGYDLAKAAWGQGYMSEALRAALQFGFTRMSLNRVEALVHPGNEASLRLLQRLGFEKEGLLRQHTHYRGEFHDHWMLALLRRQWLNEDGGQPAAGRGG